MLFSELELFKSERYFCLLRIKNSSASIEYFFQIVITWFAFFQSFIDGWTGGLIHQ